MPSGCPAFSDPAVNRAARMPERPAARLRSKLVRPLVLLSLLAPLAAPGHTAEAADPAFMALLRQADLAGLDGACAAAMARADGPQLRQLQQRLLTIHPAPQPLAVVLANARALLRCGAPDGALRVLSRVSPAPGPERRQWLLLQWRAAQEGLHHQLAVDALERLAAGDLAALAGLNLPVLERQDGPPVTRPALDVLAEHFESLGQAQRAAEVLLVGAAAGPAAPERLALAVQLLDDLPVQERQRLLEQALDQAAAAGSWALAARILDQQLALPGGSEQVLARAIARRQRLSAGLDDAYGEWLLQRLRAASPTRQAELERQLRSPREPGGHAAAAADPALIPSPPPR